MHDHQQQQHSQQQHPQPPQNHYQLLGVQRDAGADQVKAAYQQQLLAWHPDKAGQQATERFQALQHAWQVLRQPASRLLYDHQLSQAELRATVVLHDEVELDDMEQQQQQQGRQQSAGPISGSNTIHPDCSTAGSAETSRAQVPLPSYSYPCRCGDAYVLSAADRVLAAATQQIILPCRSCSNHILVQLPPP